MYTREEVKSDLALRIAKTMYMDTGDLGEDDIFSDFGLESVTLAKILAGICSHYGCTISVVEFVRRQTLREASGLIYDRITEQAPCDGAPGETPP